MIQILTAALMTAIGGLSLAACWFVCKVAASMSKGTPERIKAAFILKASGYFVAALSALDYWRGEPLGWPWLLLIGVFLTTSGTVLLHMVNRRDCLCPECPVRRIVVLTDRPHEQ